MKQLLQDDWLIKQLQFLPRKMPTLVQHSQEPLLDLFDKETGETRSVSLRQYLLELIVKLELNSAETILFNQFEKLSNNQLEEITTWFYNRLEGLSAADLAAANFSAKEIIQGRQDVKRLLAK